LKEIGQQKLFVCCRAAHLFYDSDYDYEAIMFTRTIFPLVTGVRRARHPSKNISYLVIFHVNNLHGSFGY
jgi:hypothetical protein